MDRENAIEWFTMLKEKFVNTVYGKYLEMAIKALEQEPKTGHWIKTDERYEWFGELYRCSLCGHDKIGDADYCPKCGAKMQ